MIHMTRTIAILLCTLILCSCGLAREAERRERSEKAALAFKASSDTCDAKAKSGEFKKVLSFTQCHSQALIAYAEAGEIRDIDLVRLQIAKREALADEFDKGKITLAQMNLARAQADSDFATQLEMRGSSRAMATAAIQQAEAASDQAAAASQMATQAAMPRSCTRLGSTVTCY